MSVRWRNTFHLALNVLGLLALLVALALWASRYNQRLDLTPQKKYTLSPHARQVLETIDQPVEVLTFTRAEDPRNDFMRDLLQRVRQNQPNVRYRVIDVNRNPSLARRYGATTYGQVVVESQGQQKQFSNMSEDMLIASLLQVTRDIDKTVYFVTGHGEEDISNADRDAGYSTAKSVLATELYEVKTLSLLARDVPDDATVVVIAGPEKDFLPDELLRIDRYLRERGGAVLVLMNPGDSPSLAAYLRSYRIQLTDEVAADSAYSMTAGEPLTARIPGRPTQMLVTSRLGGDPIFSYMRPVEEMRGMGDDSMVYRPILETSARGWAMPIDAVEARGDLKYVPERDREGPIPVGAEVFIPLGRDPEPVDGRVPRPVSRLMVYGDSKFANNFFIELLGNQDLFVNTINWLAEEESLIEIRPQRKEVGREQYFVSSRQGAMAFWIAAVMVPGVFLVLGIGVFFWRRLR